MQNNPNTLEKAAHLTPDEQQIVDTWKHEMITTHNGEGFDSLQSLVAEVGDDRVTPREVGEIGQTALQDVAIDPSGVMTTPQESQDIHASGNASHPYSNGIR